MNREQLRNFLAFCEDFHLFGIKTKASSALAFYKEFRMQYPGLYD